MSTVTNYVLSTARSESIPVLVVDGVDYGPGDTLPSGETARDMVSRVYANGHGREGIVFEGEGSDEYDPEDLLAEHPFVTAFTVEWPPLTSPRES